MSRENVDIPSSLNLSLCLYMSYTGCKFTKMFASVASGHQVPLQRCSHD